jgi:hypothetical protein
VAPALSQREHDVKRNVRGATNHQPVQVRVRQHRSPVADMKWSSLSTDTGDAGDGPLKNIARAYTLAGMASTVAWIAIAYVGLLHYASWEDSRYSKGERTMKVKVKSCC